VEVVESGPVATVAPVAGGSEDQKTKVNKRAAKAKKTAVKMARHAVMDVVSELKKKAKKKVLQRRFDF
jgi:hypothetical protein